MPLGTRTALIRAFWWPSGREKAGRRQRKELRAPSSSSRRMGWRRLARPKGSQLFNLPYSYKQFGPSPTPLEALQNPGWSAQRHRIGRRCKTSQRARNKLFSPRLSRDLTMTAAATPRGRPQYAALRDKIASSASGGRKTSSHRTPPLLPFSPCESPPAGFAEKTPAFVCRAAPRAARGGGGSRDPTGRRFSTCRPIPRYPPRKTTPPHGH